jgi:predicted dehydrogenase
MDLAILGTDSEILRLARAAVSQGHRITWLGDVRSVDSSEISQLAPGLPHRAADWELLLDRSTADAVLIGRGTDNNDVRAEQLKRLATEAVPILASHPVSDSVLTYYELDMIRRETGGILRHFNPLSGHPILVDLADWMLDGHPVIGTIHQLTCERRMDEASRENVLAYLARDIEFIASVAGDIRRVNAIGPNAADVSFASLQIQITTDGPASLRWSVGSRSAYGSILEATLVGEHGTVTLLARDSATNDFPSWQLTTTTDGQRNEEDLEPFHAPQVAIERLEAALAETNADRRAAASTWGVATRAMEVVDAVNLSLEKGRSIDVFQQQLTEQLAFRGAMAALGCGLLLVGFVVILLITLLGGAEGAAGRRVLPSWPVVLLCVLAFFLLLQAVPLLASNSKRRREHIGARSERD